MFSVVWVVNRKISGLPDALVDVYMNFGVPTVVR